MAIDPNIKKKADDIRNKVYGKEVRESLASGLEEMSSDVVENEGRQSVVEGRQDSVESQWQAVSDEMTDKDVISAPEIIAARDGEANLKARLDKEHQNVTAQLAQRGVDLRRPPFHLEGLIGNGLDETQTMQTLLDYVATNTDSKTAFINNIDVLIDGNLNIPVGVKLIGVESMITFRGNIVFNGKNYSQGIVYNGDLSCGYIRLEGNDITLFENEIKNIKATERIASVGVRLGKNIENVFILNNEFKNIRPFDETTKQTLPGAAARAIYVQEGKNIQIKENRFEGIYNYNDGDIIQVSTAQIPSSEPKLNEYYHDFTDVLIKDNDFIGSGQNGTIDVTKSAIKLQASGVRVLDNRIEGNFLMAVRGYHFRDNEFRGNRYNLNSVNQVFVFSTFVGLIIDEHDVTCSERINIPNESYSSNLLIIVKGKDCDLRIRSFKSELFLNNLLQECENITLSQSMGLSGIILIDVVGGTIENIGINNVTEGYDSIRFQDTPSENVRINGVSSVNTQYFIRFMNSGNVGVRIENNLIAYRTTAELGAYFTRFDDEAQDRMEVYVEDNTSFRGYTHGDTSHRPTFNLPIGHTYYDLTLLKNLTLISVNPHVWVDSAGITV